ncbi:hypothetical protein Pan110_51040 [Gimesia panareensis]|nr:hypothetical protein Pan110_51040 [Gimesia panareensis]
MPLVSFIVWNRVFVMGSFTDFADWFHHCRASRQRHTSMSIDERNSVEGRVGVKTNFCPDVAGLCPVFVLIVSIFGPILSRFDLTRGRTFRTGSKCSGGKRVKIDGISGAVASLVRCVPVLANPPRARATFGAEYEWGAADQVQCVPFWGQKRTENRAVKFENNW